MPMQRARIVSGSCAYALHVLWQNRSFTALLRTERRRLGAPRGKRGCERRCRRGAHTSPQGLHAQVRCTTGGQWNRTTMSCMSNAAARGFPVLDGAATSCEAVAGMLEDAPCLSPGACQNGKTSGEHGTERMSGLHAQDAGRRPRPPRGARDGRIQRDGMGLVFLGPAKKSFSTRRWIRRSLRKGAVFEKCDGESQRLNNVLWRVTVVKH
jgi:hypothetical protein